MMQLVIALLLLFFPLSVFAQSTPDLFNSSVQAGTAYRTSYNQYIQAKNQHLQYNTAATRLTAIEKTSLVLQSRNAWQMAYLRFLRQTLAEATNIANYPQTVNYLDLETEINALSQLDFSSSQLDSFDKINSASKNWEVRLSKTDNLVQATQLQVASARLADLQSRLLAQLSTPSASLKSTLDLIEAKIQNSISIRQKIDNQLNARRDLAGSTLKTDLSLAHKDLQEAARLLLEISFQPK